MVHRVVYTRPYIRRVFRFDNKRFVMPMPYDSKIEYLESTGTQYIDCGFKMKSGLIIDIVYDNIANGFVFGSRTSKDSNYSGITNESTSYYNIRIGNKVLYTKSRQPSGTVTVHIENDNIKINGTKVSSTSYGSSFYSGNVFLFTVNNGGKAFYGDYAKNRIRKFTVDGLIDLIPVRRGNVGYLYDKVSGKLFGNAGIGQFILGNDIND